MRNLLAAYARLTSSQKLMFFNLKQHCLVGQRPNTEIGVSMRKIERMQGCLSASDCGWQSIEENGHEWQDILADN